MYKKMIYLTSFLLVLVLAGNAPAIDYVWDNGGEGNLWSVPENWEPDGVPTTSDVVQIDLADANCIIDDSVAAECGVIHVPFTASDSNNYLDVTGGSLTVSGHIRVGDIRSGSRENTQGFFKISGGTVTSTGGRLWIGMNSRGTFTMTGGELNIFDKIEVGKEASGNGVIYMHGGTINFEGNSTDLELGTRGRGTIYMTGGVINVEDYIKLAQDDDATGVGHIYLYGGTLNADNLRDPEQIYGEALIDITEGILVLNTDRRSVVNEYINRGWIVAYGGLGLLNVEYTADPNQTTVTASNLPPELASNPSPRNRTTVSRPVTLGWEPGMYAASHDVYFGTDPNAVLDANNVKDVNDIALWTEFQGNQDPCSFDPGPLELGKTYYWRIDEVNEADPNSPWKGVVWEFMIEDYVVIDGFESYNEIPDTEEGSNLVYNTWSDGYGNETVNGSTFGYVSGNSLETDNVNSGDQSVALGYNNTTATYSEVTVNIADLGISGDWTVDNLNALSLWFYGGQNNVVIGQMMYIKLNGVKVEYDGQMSDLTQPTWQEWDIDLDTFGIDLSNVTELSIGVEKTGTASGSGSLLIDDLRLYVSGDQEQVL